MVCEFTEWIARPGGWATQSLQVRIVVGFDPVSGRKVQRWLSAKTQHRLSLGA
jgi:hypothetical protein